MVATYGGPTPNPNMVSIVYAAFCIVIMFFSYGAFRKIQEKFLLFLGIAFGLLAIPHILIYKGLGVNLVEVVLLFRMAAYLFILYGIYQFTISRK
jgi:hypothetical protein